jgi:hypothetical protein
MNTHDLNIVITRLAMANGSGDKELEVFQNALAAALQELEGNITALAKVAHSVIDTLGSDIDDDPYKDSEDLNCLKEHCA